MLSKSKTEPNTAYHIRLQPEEKKVRLKLDEAWRYRDLVRLLTRRTFTVTYQQTVLGPLWIIINPVLASLIYMFVFGHIADVGTAGIPQILFYFVSSAVWELFSFSLTKNSQTFVANAYLFSKVYFPRICVPISNMLVSILKFLIQLLIVAGLLTAFVIRGNVHPMWALYPLLPLLFLQMALFGMSVGVLISSVTTKYRDLLAVVNVLVNLWMYGSAVVYPIQSVPDGVLKILVKVNPVSENMELIRMILLGEGEFDLLYYLVGLAVTILLFFFSIVIFNRVERTFADTV
ncbi:MAG TPA: ABC transporter permease [Clostridiales bacterium]|nr:ABC transporter permease [Saccharofermentanaceae bacterium]HBY32256.1 ABC transporter permease [Clostridiales bacterium]